MSHNVTTAATSPEPNEGGMSRRSLLQMARRAVMGAGLVGGYGFFAWIAGRFMLPAHIGQMHRLFVGRLNELEVGATFLYQTPDGRSVNITRKGADGSATDFIALSSTCPHLGCTVRWEAQNDRYFCPCHNGTFDPSGKATGGPPGDAGLSLPCYALAVEKGLLYVQVPAEQLSMGRQAAVVTRSAPGAAPCRGCDKHRQSAPPRRSQDV